MSDSGLLQHWRGRARHRLARFALGLPGALQLRLAGGRPIVVDGLTLQAELQLMFTLRTLLGATSLTEGTPAQCRRRVRSDALEHQGPTIEVAAVTELEVAGGAGPVRARHYAPRGGAGAPLLVYCHGGGFVVGDLDTTDNVCRLLCRHAGVHVLSIDYRLAPEHPFPAAFDDARAAFLWACANAAALGADVARVGVGGDSAGGQLAASLALALASERARGVDVRAPFLQLLLYPAIDREKARPSLAHFAEGFLLERRDIERFQAWYTPQASALDDARCAPLRALRTASGLAGLAPALVVTAGFDPLRDEGEEYAALLEDAGNVCVLRRFDGLIHGFANLIGVSAASRDALIEVAGTMRALFESAPAAVEPLGWRA